MAEELKRDVANIVKQKEIKVYYDVGATLLSALRSFQAPPENILKYCLSTIRSFFPRKLNISTAQIEEIMAIPAVAEPAPAPPSVSDLPDEAGSTTSPR